MPSKESNSSKTTARKMIAIESKTRLTSDTINVLCNEPMLLKEYLESSMANTFSELLFRLTHEIYLEDKAVELWRKISEHKTALEKRLKRDVGVLVAALDYLSNISGDIAHPKIMDDVRIEEAAEMATRDFLTGLYLRGVFEFSLKRMIQEHQRHKKPLSLLLLDIDGFKDINDQYGHLAGDQVLKKLGTIVLENIRASDFPARYGGEEISILLTDTSLKNAAELAEKLCALVRERFKANRPSVTVSIGVSCIPATGMEPDANLVHQADKALYRAKKAGKNRVASYHPDVPPRASRNRSHQASARPGGRSKR